MNLKLKALGHIGADIPGEYIVSVVHIETSPRNIMYKLYRMYIRAPDRYLLAICIWLKKKLFVIAKLYSRYAV